jgi:CDP-diacylglycerol---serine O-phosphatidyltransferase
VSAQPNEPIAPQEEPRRRRGCRLPFRRVPRRPRRFDFKKALFVLPNAFTVSSIFCGFYAILRCTTDPTPHGFYQAGIALFFAGFFDAFDGRIARMTRTQSDFGVQMDSLADVISFGVAPGILVHQWALSSMGTAGKIVAFSFCACGTIRLARFNVLAARGVGSSKFFVGLPIPAAALMLVSTIMAQSHVLDEPVRAIEPVVVLVIVLAYLMVSHVRFRTFKDFRPSVRSAPVLLVLAIALGAAVVVLSASVTLVLAVGGYIMMGLGEEVLFFRKRRQAERAALDAAAPAPSPDAPAAT